MSKAVSALQKRLSLRRFVLQCSCLFVAIGLIGGWVFSGDNRSLEGNTEPTNSGGQQVTEMLHLDPYSEMLNVYAKVFITEPSTGLSPVANTLIPVCQGQTVTIEATGQWICGPTNGAWTGGEYLSCAIGQDGQDDAEIQVVGDQLKFVANSSGYLFLGTHDLTTDDNYEELTVKLSINGPVGGIPVDDPMVDIAKSEPVRSRMVGRNMLGGRVYEDQNDEPMIGMRIWIGELVGFKRYTVISGVQPLYNDPANPSSFLEGAVLGEKTGIEELVVAKSGYALSGIQITKGMETLRLQFGKLVVEGNTQRLSLKEQYASDYYGDQEYTDGVVLTRGMTLLHGLQGVDRGKIRAIGIR